MTITTKATAKVAAVAAGLAMATSMLSLAPLAHAATCDVGTAPLTLGSTGAGVICLQTSLVAGGYLTMPAGVAMGYFGTLTQSAVAKWQAANGVMPSVGYFGPISMAKFNAMGGGSTGGVSTVPGCAPGAAFSSTTGAACTTTSTTVPGCAPGAAFSSTTGAACGTGTPSTPTGPLAGTDGSITDVTELGSFNDEDVSEGDTATKILGADIEASNDGDIALKTIKVSFDPSGNTGSDNLDDYIESVSVWLGSTKVGSADVDEFSQDSNDLFTKSITLSGNTTIKAEEVAKLYIAVDAASNIDSNDLTTDSWTVDIENIRFVDGSGVFTTDDSTGDINGMDVPVDFVTFSTNADTELKITTASDTPEAGIAIIDDSSDTEDVSLLKGKLKLDGSSDAVLDEFPVTFTTVGGANLAAVTGSVTLKIGTETFTETMDITGALVGTITFDNLDFTIDAGDTVNFEVLADINDIDTGNLDEGDTLKADVTATNRNYIDIENEENDQLSDSTEKSGTASGEAQEFRTSGIMLTLVSVDESVTSGTSIGDDIGLFTIKYKVTAVGDTVYVSSLADATTAANTDGKTSITIDRSGTATATNISVALVNNTDTDLTSVGLFQIEEGEAETFTISASVPMNAAVVGQHRMSLSGVRWTTDSTDSSPSNSYTSNLDSFKTAYEVLN